LQFNRNNSKNVAKLEFCRCVLAIKNIKIRAKTLTINKQRGDWNFLGATTFKILTAKYVHALPVHHSSVRVAVCWHLLHTSCVDHLPGLAVQIKDMDI
jgi:hypothetical protein